VKLNLVSTRRTLLDPTLWKVSFYQPGTNRSPRGEFLAAPHPSPGEEITAFGRIVRNAVALSFSRPLTWLSATALTILLPRYLGDVNLGKINAAFAFADWCGLLVSLGIATYLTKEVARRGQAAGSLILNAALLRLVLAALVTVLAMLLATVITHDQVTRQLIFLLSGHMVLTVISAVLVGGLQGMQQLRAVAVFDAAAKIALLAFVAAFLVGGLSPLEVAAAYILSDLVGIAGFVWALYRNSGLSGPIDVGSWRSLIKGGVPFVVWEASLLTYARIDVVFLSVFATSAVLGWYYAAYRIISIPLFLPAILMTVTFPALSASVGNRELFNAIGRKAVQTTVLLSVPMSFGLIVLPGKLVDLFGYPDSFSNAVLPIALLAAGLPLVAVNMIIAPALAALDRQRQWALAGVGAAILNPALNFVAIPYTQSEFGNGGIGAAAVTTLTEVYLLGVALWLLPSGVLDLATWKHVSRSFFAGLVMAGDLLLVLDLPVLILIPLGAVIYAVVSWAMGNVELADLRTLRNYLRRPARQMGPAEPPLAAVRPGRELKHVR
jgi:O-antigen/teichoic acid export membrane protein